MGFLQSVGNVVFKDDAKRLGLKISISRDTVRVGALQGRFSGSRAEVTSSSSRGTLARSVLSAGWQRRGKAYITVVTPDGVEMVSEVKDETKARRFVAQYNTRSGAHEGN